MVFAIHVVYLLNKNLPVKQFIYIQKIHQNKFKLEAQLSLYRSPGYSYTVLLALFLFRLIVSLKQ